ncbi:MAG TPA: RNA methyltransferase [Burkholderiales bacterium]
MIPTNSLDNVRIVLVHPTHPGNIGASARAMKTMGLSSLVLVNPKRFPDREAEALASGALDVLAEARLCASLDEALSGTVLAAALSVRQRELSHTAYHAKEAAGIVLEQARQHPVALVFGGEISGLSNEEIIKCQMLVHIPANPDYSSLNLAAAVQVMCYELRLALENLAPQPSEFEAASFEEVEMFYRHLEEVMVSTRYLNPDKPKRLMERLRRLFARARLEKEEVNILRGILKAFSKIVD